MVCNNILHDIDFVRGATRGDEIEPKLNKNSLPLKIKILMKILIPVNRKCRKYSVKTETEPDSKPKVLKSFSTFHNFPRNSVFISGNGCAIIKRQYFPSNIVYFNISIKKFQDCNLIITYT